MNYNLAEYVAEAIAKNVKNIKLCAGTWRLHKPLVLNDIHGLTIHGENAAVSGAIPLSARWRPFRDGIFVTETDRTFDCLIVNGRMMRMARWPNFCKDEILGGSSPETMNRASHWKNPDGAFFHTLHRAMWGSLHYTCNGRLPDGSLSLDGGWQMTRQSEAHPIYQFIENVFEELDEPGEWFLDRDHGLLYLFPENGINPANAEIETVSLESLIELRNCSDVKIDGIKFCGTARTFMKTREPLMRSDWCIYRGGALFTENCKNIAVDNCEFSNLGGNAVFINGHAINICVENCHIHDCGASGVVFCGLPESAHVQYADFEKIISRSNISLEPGPARELYPRECSVANCLVHDIGLVEKQIAGVEIELASHIEVSNCTIYHVPRAGINIGDGCFGGHYLHDCDVFDTVRETSDHGAFNSWGRDRFWHLDGLDANADDASEYARLDCIEPTRIEHNRMECGHGWDIDLDDGSSNYVIRNNLMLSGGLKLREGFYRIAENNITIRNSFHPHVWYKHSKDIVRNNIFCLSYKPIGMPDSPWGDDIDHNFLRIPGEPTCRPASELSADSHRDINSLAGDIVFSNPKAGDFSVPTDSGAYRAGFRNFSMDSFGVLSPELRALVPARTFSADDSDSATIDDTNDKIPREFGRFGLVRNINGLGDQSAYGLPEPHGILILSDGILRKDDVIIACGKKSVADIAELTKALSGGGFQQLKVIRGQTPVLVDLLL